jgi:hypothetical protein
MVLGRDAEEAVLRDARKESRSESAADTLRARGAATNDTTIRPFSRWQEAG